MLLKLGYITAKRCSDYSNVLQQYGSCNCESHDIKFILCIKRYRSKYLQIWLATVVTTVEKNVGQIKFTHVKCARHNLYSPHEGMLIFLLPEGLKHVFLGERGS